MAFAQHKFDGTRKVGDAPVSEHMASVNRQLAQLGRRPAAAAVVEPELPEGARHIWRAFMELHRTRSGGFGPGPITFAEIDAWQRVMRCWLKPWEVDALRAVDDAFLTTHDKKPETVKA